MMGEECTRCHDNGDRLRSSSMSKHITIEIYGNVYCSVAIGADVADIEKFYIRKKHNCQ